MANEKRLIDGNRLKMRMIAFATAIKREYLSIEAIVDTINTEDTVDAVEVVHGRWEEWWPPKHMILTGEDMLYRCSACTAKYADISGLNYCPFCGAKMDLQTEVTDEPDFI